MIQISRPIIDEETIKAVVDVLRSGNLAQGAKVLEFENAFADYIGVRHAVATSNGTTALHAALLANGIGAGDEVITTPFTFIATANSILYTGAKPVFADIEEDTFNIDVEKIKEAINHKTKAILPVHLYGQPCDIKAICELCEDHNILLIEDASQAHGAEFGGKRVGSFGTGCFSFYPTKNMTTGEGGMITTDNVDVAKRARLLINHGSSKRYHNEILGYNYRMTDISAAIGICQIKKIDIWNEKRIYNANFLSDSLKNIKDMTIPSVRDGRKHVFHQYTVRISSDFPIDRNGFISALEANGIGCSIYYPVPVHMQEFYRKINKIQPNNLGMTERLSKEVVSIPVHPSLSQEDLNKIVSVMVDLNE